MLVCNFALRCIYLLKFPHDAVHILASPEPITGGAPNCKTGELGQLLIFQPAKFGRMIKIKHFMYLKTFICY